MTVTSRGTSNKNQTGSAESRRRRKARLLKRYRADVDVIVLPVHPDVDATDPEWLLLRGHAQTLLWSGDATLLGYVDAHGQVVSALDPDVVSCLFSVPQGEGEAAARCYRCGLLVWFCTLEVDRIIPGKRGGKYRDDNVRPACGGPKGCNIITGNEERWSSHKPFRLFAELLDHLRERVPA
jgi:hypothetical protein